MYEPVMNTTPEGFDAARDLPEGFLDFYRPLHAAYTSRQQAFLKARHEAIDRAHAGNPPTYLPRSEANGEWSLEVPDWCADQRNQMTGPADDGALVVKMLNSGAPGVMIDLEDSMANAWDCHVRGISNILAALQGTLTYEDKKRGRTVAIKESSTVILNRVRGLHLSQVGVLEEVTSASLFDVALLAYQVDRDTLKHPLTFYIPKSETAAEAAWWNDLFNEVETLKGWPAGEIKCFALVESHSLAFQMEEFLYNLKDHILGLNLGRWDYMASLIHYNYANPDWVLPNRNTVPHDIPFFQRLRNLLAWTCHRHGALAIGGMTALYPSRVDAELNERALTALAADKKNEADCLFDGAWTGHPDQNQIAVDQFPAPNQLARLPQLDQNQPDLRAIPTGVGVRTVDGTRAAVRTVIRYRNGVLNGRGASLLDGYMEDLATDRIYRLMIAQRMKHRNRVAVLDEQGNAVEHTPELVCRIFDEELERLLGELGQSIADIGTPETFTEARRLAESMVRSERFNPI